MQYSRSIFLFPTFDRDIGTKRELTFIYGKIHNSSSLMMNGFEEQHGGVATVANSLPKRAAIIQLWQIVGKWEHRPMVTRFPQFLKARH